MPDLALGLQLLGDLIGVTFLEMGVVPGPLGVHQVEIEIVHPAGLQLALKEGPDVLLRLKEVGGELVGQDVLLPGIAAGEAGLQRPLALALQVAVGGVEVVEARAQEGVDHFRRLRDVDLFALHRQAHESKAKILFDVLHANAPSCLTCPCGHGLY